MKMYSLYSHTNGSPLPSFLFGLILMLQSCPVINASVEWDELESTLSSSAILIDGGFDGWITECIRPMEEAWFSPCGQDLTCKLSSEVLLGVSNYLFIDRPQDKTGEGIGGQCMVFGHNCVNKNCEWPYTEEEGE